MLFKTFIESLDLEEINLLIEKLPEMLEILKEKKKELENINNV